MTVPTSPRRLYPHMLCYVSPRHTPVSSHVVLSPRHTPVSSPIDKSHKESHERSVDAPTVDATLQVKRERYRNTPSICVENEPKVEQ